MREEIGQRKTSAWTRFTQQEIDAFGRVTRDVAPLHMDPQWARQNGPYGSTIAYGFQTLAMLTYFNHEIFGWPADGTAVEGYAVNYGLERVRFTGPVPVDRPFRCHLTLMSLEQRDAGQELRRFLVEVEVEGFEKPALVAEWLGLWITEPGHATVQAKYG